jgi:hypothetical protein
MAKAKPKPAPPPAATQFVVERLNWRRQGLSPAYRRLPGFTRVRSFDTPDEAEQFRHAEEQKARAVVNPFDGGMAQPVDQTDLPEHALCDWYMDHDFTPPKPDKKGKRDWAKWWAKESKKWKPERAAVAWEPLHKVRFYRVVERPRVPVGYVLVRINWDYNDQWYEADEEGGTVVSVYRDRAKADKECGRRNRESVRGWGKDELGFELNGRTLPDRTPFDPPPEPAVTPEWEEVLYTAGEMPFWEVVEIELEGVR